MGGRQFENEAVAVSAQVAYDALVADARSRYGWDPYAGTIAVTEDFGMVAALPGEARRETIRRVIDWAWAHAGAPGQQRRSGGVPGPRTRRGRARPAPLPLLRLRAELTRRPAAEAADTAVTGAHGGGNDERTHEATHGEFGDDRGRCSPRDRQGDARHRGPSRPRKCDALDFHDVAVWSVKGGA
jgi:hypothetical protein